MKRFLLKALLLIFCCILLLLALSPAYLILLNQDYAREEAQTLQFKYIPDSIDVACFGSSHAGNGFQSPRYHDGTLFNFYMSMQSPIMDHLLYAHFRDHLAENAIVIIDLSYFSLYSNNTHSVNHYKRYCTFISVRELPNASAKLYRLFRIIDFDFNPIISCVLGKTAELEPFQTTTTSERFTAEELENIGSGLASAFIDMSGDQTIDPEIDSALREMLEDCLQQGYRPVLVTTPYQHQLNDAIPDAFLARFRADCESYATEYNIPYLDYSHDTRFADAPHLFVDSDHLTSDGSEAFMKIFFQDLQAYEPST